jgi:putative PIN family toxin of toxin-antitoxin system
MNLVIDTNIIFSALLKSHSQELEIIQSTDIEVFVPKFLIIEIFKHKEKIIRISKLNEEEILESLYLILKYCTIFNEEDISEEIKITAFKYVEDIDLKDFIFVATALTLNAYLWSGDKKLINGLKAKGADFLIRTNEILEKILND